tara:strand:- start:512 stop:970 length:459 start_codon:yes stop_codon:yes gene_type:complete
MEIFYKKGFIKIKQNIDFNFLTSLFQEDEYRSIFSKQCHQDHILNTSIQIMNIENNSNLKNIYNILNKNFNPHNIKTDLHAFFSFNSGSSGRPHRDPYGVFLLGAYGKTLYIVEGKEYLVEKGDVLTIPQNALHKSISITPRIVLSLGTKVY